MREPCVGLQMVMLVLMALPVTCLTITLVLFVMFHTVYLPCCGHEGYMKDGVVTCLKRCFCGCCACVHLPWVVCIACTTQRLTCVVFKCARLIGDVMSEHRNGDDQQEIESLHSELKARHATAVVPLSEASRPWTDSICFCVCV